ncbi:MAG: endonuclease/exonuclease/phosphatase family protein [Clostridia bacterium]|nr:endonuclease/exonuclease/phosphatase family protein [Clostridia bacterium]
MKKSRILCFALALILLVSALFGCNNKNQTDTETQAPSKTSPLTINGVALKDYTVVCSNQTISGAGKALLYLNEKLEELYGITLKGELSSKDRYEILIGFSGNDAEIKQAYDQNPTGLIGATEKKIVLLGANYSALCQVIDAFLAKATEAEGSKEISISGYEFPKLNNDSLNVMTYNILFDMDKEGRRSDCRTRMVETILENDVDVLGTQEDGADHSNFFIENLKTYDIQKGDSDEGNYIYWKKDKFNVIKKGYYFLSDTPEKRSKFDGSNHYRTMTYVILEVKETGKQFFFVNTHLDYQAKEEVRVKQIDVLTSLVKKLNKNDLPLVILGDFNTTQTTSGSAILHFMSDNPNLGMTSKVAKTKNDTGGTLVNGFVDRDNRFVFDYIFVSTDTVYTKYYTVVNNIKNGKYPSDHLPVLAKIDVY